MSIKRKNADLDNSFNGNDTYSLPLLAKRSKLDPNAKEFVPASTSKKSCGWSRPVQRVIKDNQSDEAFIQRLKESRKYWGFKERPSYEGLDCAWCDGDPPSESEEEYEGDINDLKEGEYTVSFYGDDFYRHNQAEIRHDMCKLMAYYLDCEDKSKKHECKLCIEWYNNGEKEDEDHYYCEEDCDCYESKTKIYSDDETSDESSSEEESDEKDVKRKFVFKKRSQNILFMHIGERHQEKMKVFFFEHQDIIPSHSFWDCEYQYGFHNMIAMMENEDNLEYLNMEKPKTPPPPAPRLSPRSPKWYAWWDR